MGVHVTTIQCLRAALGPTMLELAGLSVHEIKKERENTKFHKQSDCVNSLLRAVTKRDMKLGVLWSWARDRSPASMYCRGGGAWRMRLRCDGRSRRFNSRAWFAATLSDCMKKTAPLLVQRLLDREVRALQCTWYLGGPLFCRPLAEMISQRPQWWTTQAPPKFSGASNGRPSPLFSH